MRISLGQLLISLFAVILLVVVGQGIYAVTSLNTISVGTNQIVDKRVPSFILMGQINADLGDIRVAQSNYRSAATPEQRAVFLGSLNNAYTALEQARKQYEPLIVDKEDQALYDTFSKDWAKAEQLWQKVKTLTDSGNADEAKQLFLGDSLATYAKAGDDIQAAVDDLASNVKDEGASNAEQISLATTVTYIALALAFSIGIGAALISSLRVVRPLKHMTDNMRTLSSGDTSGSVPYMSRKDEIGAMAAALQVFKDGILRNRALEAEAASAREKAESEKLRLQQDAEAAAQKKLLEATSGLASGLKRLAAGDLGFELKEPFAPEFEALRLDLNAAVAQLGSTIATVATSANAISDGSREVSQSADDLSKRTEQQAASLEETAAALDQITVNVSNSSKRVEEARGVAKEANSSAVHSGQVVNEAINAMQRIEQSSNQISNIITVIDEIAFQTNLLALNAGVEAARAGEAGRGFAVVATEVRELAQRSAKAAREIKELINKSTQEVENGVRQVQETGEVLKAIEQHVTTINGLMDAIATSSREQSVGLSEVNTAVNQMDQVTQQNAAMVEETSAASANLAQESVRLQQLVSDFTLPNTTSNQRRRAA
ncbi:HAMP domain-containing methyl-accepting chemotaxis protein [Agrobacterium vitis]|uniref:HAMP domain-containing methyl-accepting chemotaxis protein n=1 Tax=Agrobacterium vitis TaxID=373 RepID=UPI0012E98238|nr:HAMP domain-containing methyl-accepting chemotaxis protein [Agrobacterium vitis]MUZ64046.1 HAMP domain-containing protein [Agrobacterium vitis]MVA19821.1 HAMP domain-containing protein [Agrobacterium vitis]